MFEGTARFVGGGADMTIKAGDVVELSGADVVAATVERAAPDDFVKWCRARDYQEKELAAPYHVSPAMTGFEELDADGGWATAPQYGAVWYPTSLPADWAPYRDGQWVWVEPWGWTWVDAEPWGFAPFHYGRWAYIDDRWGWVPGNFVPHPVYAPALVAFIADIGVAAPPQAGPPVGWFPLAPGEVYWPSYTRDPAYIANINIANVSGPKITEVTRAARAQRSAGSPPLVTHQQFANRRAATVVPANVFAGSARVASAALAVPPQTVQHAQVSPRPPQLAPAAARPTLTTPSTLNQAAQPPARAAAHPAGPPDFHALASAPSGPHGHPQILQQPGRAAPGPPNFSHLAPAGSHGQLSAAPAAAPPSPGQATAAHPPRPPNFSHFAPATGTQHVSATTPPAQAAQGGPARPAPLPQTAPRDTQRAAEGAAQQRAAAQAAAQYKAQQRAAPAQAAAQQRAAVEAAAQHEAQQRAAAAQAAAQTAAQRRAAAQHAPPQQQAHDNCGHPGQQGCLR